MNFLLAALTVLRNGLRADPKQTQIGPKADADFWKANPKPTPTELKSNPGSAFGVRSGVSWVWSLL